MRRYAALFALVASTSALVSGCGSIGETPKNSGKTTVVVIQQEGAVGEAGAIDQGLVAEYNKVLDNPGSYEFNKTDNFTPAGTYSYAVFDITGDNVPELMLKADVKDYYAPVTVFSRGADGTVTNTKDVVISGVASAGGGRASVFAAGSGKGIYQALWDSRNPDAAVQAYELDGQNLTKQGQESKILLSTLPDDEHQQITWVPANDRSGVQALRTPLASTKDPQGNMGNAPAGLGQPHGNAAPSGTCGSAGGFGVDADGSTTSCEFAKSIAEAVSSSQTKTGIFAVQASSPITGQSYTMNCSESSGTTVCRGGNNAVVTLKTAGSANSPKQTAGSVVLEGTVVLKHPSELMNGKPTPNGEPESNEYILLWFDTPREVTGQKSGTPNGTTTNQTYGVSLGKKESFKYGSPSDSTGPWRQYVGKRIRITTTTEALWYQSDAGMPLSAVRLDNKGSFTVETLP
ncbi:hypothetical protein [Corynebacterium epidermidicanis]|uniref:Lipoprotein n=1 Tax=Corynebacterium epidermidicanis TaxID=1050174 RepID=A0A0G3GRJ7_9CORY|nr:hypothetical protein [Corynebacterium epidermidicanis]AKK03744.1 hypothetical protein CEPID_09495 [Corynebacterium epidermidicanis]